MTKKLLLLLTSGIFLLSGINAQEQSQTPKANTYNLQIQGVTDKNLQEVKTLLIKVTSTSDIVYNVSSNTFVISSFTVLDKNIISGKMQKNFFPVTKFQVAGDKDATFPKMKNTGDPEADAANYAAEKSKWIQENPEAYQLMLNNPSTNPTPNK